MLSGKARKNWTEADAATRRNQLSMSKLAKVTESEQWQAAVARDKVAFAAVSQRAAVYNVSSSSADRRDESLDAVLARMRDPDYWSTKGRLEHSGQPTSRVEAREERIPDAGKDTEDEEEDKWAHLATESLPEMPNTLDLAGPDLGDDEPVLAWGPSGRKPGLFTNADGNLRFIAVMTSCPGLMTLCMWFVAMSLSLGLVFLDLAALPLDQVFTQGAEYDMYDVRSIKQDSLKLAIERTGAAWVPDALNAGKTQRPMSKTLTALSFIYAAGEDSGTIFTPDAARALKEAEGSLIDHPDFPVWCQRTYAADFKTGSTRNESAENDAAYACDYVSLSPLQYLYASVFDPGRAERVLQQLSDPNVYHAYKVYGRCLDHEPHDGLSRVEWEQTCDPNAKVHRSHKEQARQVFGLGP